MTVVSSVRSRVGGAWGRTSGLAIALGLAACGGSQAVTTTGTTPVSVAPPSREHVVANTNGPPPLADGVHIVAANQGTTAEESAGQIMVSGPGFTPQLLRAAGVAGGPVDGNSLSPGGCVGHYPSVPQHVLKIGRRVPLLRVLVDGVDTDLTVAVRMPDGTVLCNDDSGDPRFSLNPAIDFPAEAGEVEVFVGTYGDREGARYQLGVTEQPNTVASDLR